MTAVGVGRPTLTTLGKILGIAEQHAVNPAAVTTRMSPTVASKPTSVFAKLAAMAKKPVARTALKPDAPDAKGTKPDIPPEDMEDDDDADEGDDTDDDDKKRKKKRDSNTGDEPDADDTEDEELAAAQARAASQAALILEAGKVRRGESVQTFKPLRQPFGVKATPEGILAAGRKRRGEK